MKTSDIISKLKQETARITNNPLLDRIELDKLKAFETTAETNADYKRKLKQFETLATELSYIYDKKYQDLYNIYNELVVFELLSAKISTEFIAESGSAKTPDYKLSLTASGHIFSDLKTLHFIDGNLNYIDGNLNYIDIQNQGVASKIALEKEMKEVKRHVYFSEPVSISPFRRGNSRTQQDYRAIIEDLMAKTKNNYKSEQVNYQESQGLYIVDASNLLIPPGKDQALPVTKGRLYKEPNSGILWNAAFAQAGDPVYNWIEFEGKPNIRNRFNRNGILNDPDFKSLKAIAFITGEEEHQKVIGFHRSTDFPDTLGTILYRVCDVVNDETNSHYYEME